MTDPECGESHDFSRAEDVKDQGDEKQGGSGMVGPIIFSHPIARAELLGAETVFTYRENERTTGETHARWERTGTGKADVIVEHAEAVDPSEATDLMPYWERSGFSSIEGWQEAIRSLNGWYPDGGHIYRVTLEGLRVTPNPDYQYAVGDRSTHDSRHDAVGEAVLTRRVLDPSRDSEAEVYHYPVCRCEEKHASEKYPYCQLCGGTIEEDQS